MLVERMLPAARNRLVTIRDDAPLIDAATLLRDLDSDLVVVCNSDELLVGVITKTDVVRQISHCHGSGCITAASSRHDSNRYPLPSRRPIARGLVGHEGASPEEHPDRRPRRSAARRAQRA